MTEEEKTLYAIGVYLSKQVEPFDLKPEEVTQVQKGFADGVAGTKPVVTVEEYIPKIQALQMARMQAASEKVRGRKKRRIVEKRRRNRAQPRPPAACSSSIAPRARVHHPQPPTR